MTKELIYRIYKNLKKSVSKVNTIQFLNGQTSENTFLPKDPNLPINI